MFDKLLEKLSSDKTSAADSTVLASSSNQFAPNTKIAYNPELIAALKQDHSELLSLYWKTLTAAQNRKTKLTRKLLTEFKDLLVDHLLKENISLYIYLRHAADMPSSREAVKSVKAEMDSLGRQVMKFLEKSTRKDAVYDSLFIHNFSQIGDALTERIEHEERYVYPNYQPL